jgi:hypothetical protein
MEVETKMADVELTDEEIKLIISLCYRTIKTSMAEQRILEKGSVLFNHNEDLINQCDQLDQKLRLLLPEDYYHIK